MHSSECCHYIYFFIFIALIQCFLINMYMLSRSAYAVSVCLLLVGWLVGWLDGWMVGCNEDLRRFSCISAISRLEIRR